MNPSSSAQPAEDEANKTGSCIVCCRCRKTDKKYMTKETDAVPKYIKPVCRHNCPSCDTCMASEDTTAVWMALGPPGSAARDAAPCECSCGHKFCRHCVFTTPDATNGAQIPFINCIRCGFLTTANTSLCLNVMCQYHWGAIRVNLRYYPEKKPRSPGGGDAKPTS